MKARCGNPNNRSYPHYGGRGIKVNDCWLHDYNAFKEWAYANGYSDNLTIDRIDNNKGYSPDNCRWIPKEKQASNRRMNFYFTYRSRTLCLSEWCKELGLFKHYSNIKRRIVELGMSFEEAVSMPIKDNSSLDISGLRFGKWTAISFSHKKGHHAYWLCKCVCGREFIVRKDHLISGRSCSCNHCKNQTTSLCD